MNKFSIKSTYIAALPRSYKRRGGGGAASPISGSSVTGGVSRAYVDENFVDLASEQDIFGIKNFVTGLKVGGILVSYNAAKNAFVFSANAIFEGGVAWNSSLDGFEPQTVTDAVNVDGVTIGRTTSGALTVLAGAGGGINEAQLADYLTNNNYAKKSDIPSLSGYATQVWVNEQCFLKSITSEMVTSALSYTPFNAANFTKNNIKNTLGISDWALASAKPSYIASEVGALAADGTAVNSSKLLDVGLANGNGRNGIPTLSETGYMEVGIAMDFHRYDDGVDFSTRLRVANGNFGNIVWLPTSDGTIALTSDIPTNLSQFTDDVVKGRYLSTSGGTVNGNITATGNVSAQSVIANGGITAGSVLSFVDTDASEKIVLQRNSGGDILFCGGFADRNVYIDGSILRVRTENTIFSRGISTTGVTLSSGGKSAVISYNAAKNAFVFPANAIFEGGVAWNSSLDGFEPQTVTDAVNVDGVTIGRTTSGALTVLAGAGGGINEAQLADYLTNNNYAKKSDIPSLSGYATQVWVNEQCFLKSITSEMVTSALSYTPFNAANFTKNNIKNTLGISDWALASAKPSYIASEVGALAADGTAVNSSKLLDVGLANGNGRNGIPTLSETGYMEVGIAMDFHRYDDGVDFSTRLRVANGNFGNIVWLPTSDGTIALTSDIPTNLSQFTDDVVKGRYLSTSGGTVNGNITATGNVSAQSVIANGGITAGSVLSFVDTDASEKIVLQRNSGGDILFCGGFADRNVYIDGSILRVRTENTIFSRGISTTGVTLSSGGKSAVISYNAAKNAFVFPANAIFEGGVAWNSPMDGTSAYASELERRIEALQTEVDTLKQTVQTLTA